MITSFILKKQSILSGIARNADIFGSIKTYDLPKDSQEMDYIAYLNDCNALYGDMQKACKIVLSSSETAV